jgi:hypothetical protein
MFASITKTHFEMGECSFKNLGRVFGCNGTAIDSLTPCFI